MEVKSHHWLNTIVGILDSSLILTPEEQLSAIEIINKLLNKLDIDNRRNPDLIPASVANEIKSGYYSKNMDSYITSGKRPRLVLVGEIQVSLDAWRDMFLNMFIISYPDLLPEERIFISSIFIQLLSSLGIPERAVMFFPDDVVKAWQNSPEANLGADC